MIKYHLRIDDQLLVKIRYGVLANRSGVLASKNCKGRFEGEVVEEARISSEGRAKAEVASTKKIW
jgi:hypothetical protein